MKSTEKNFGYLFAIIFFLIAFSYQNTDYKSIFIGLGALLLLSATFKPVLLKPLNKAWIGLGMLLNKITAPIIILFIYFFIITPYGIYFRLTGRDLLELKYNKALTSYWHDRKSDCTFKNQF